MYSCHANRIHFKQFRGLSLTFSNSQSRSQWILPAVKFAGDPWLWIPNVCSGSPLPIPPGDLKLGECIRNCSLCHRTTGLHINLACSCLPHVSFLRYRASPSTHSRDEKAGHDLGQAKAIGRKTHLAVKLWHSLAVHQCSLIPFSVRPYLSSKIFTVLKYSALGIVFFLSFF